MTALKKLQPANDATDLMNALPTSKSERYKYTNIAAALKGKDFTSAATPVRISGATEYAQTVSDLAQLPQWAADMLNATPAGQEMYQDTVLWELANATSGDAVVLHVAKNTQQKTALELGYTGANGQAYAPRQFIRIEENAEAVILERHDGTGAFWNNAVTQIHVGKGAHLRHYRIQNNDMDAIYTQNMHVVVEKDATYDICVLTTGSGLSRNQMHVELQGEGGEVYLSGMNLLSGSQLADTTITIEHQAPNCHSNQNYKSIIDDKAHGVFQGKVHVHQIAQKTDGYQLSNALVLSPTAIMDTKPELEIYADDVKCSHGATTGQMDTAPLFYLRTRGLSEAQAKMLLMQAFLGPVLDQLKDEAQQELFAELSLKWLEQHVAK